MACIVACTVHSIVNTIIWIERLQIVIAMPKLNGGDKEREKAWIEYWIREWRAYITRQDCTCTFKPQLLPPILSIFSNLKFFFIYFSFDLLGPKKVLKKPRNGNSISYIFSYFSKNQIRKKNAKTQKKKEKKKDDAERITITIIIKLCRFFWVFLVKIGTHFV